MPTTKVTPTDLRDLQTIADTIHASKKIIVVTGAGVSTNCGIPDFRSTHGLYNQVKAEYGSSLQSNITQGKDLFDSVIWKDAHTTQLFYTFITKLRNEIINVKDTTVTHKFIRTLAETGRLQRCYTQNIDGLEGREGLLTDLSLGKGPPRARKRKREVLAGMASEAELPGTDVVTAAPKGCQVVQLHGELDTLRCHHCQGQCEYDEERVATLLAGQSPACPTCLAVDQERRDAGKRGTRVGGLRPNIVLYGEEHPQGDLIGTISSSDISARPDLMIIFGTSLKVYGLRALVKDFANSIHSKVKKDDKHPFRVIFVNNEPAANSIWKDVIDAWVEMDCDAFVNEMKRLRPAVWERQEKIEAGFRRAGAAAAGKESKSGKGQSGGGRGVAGKVVKNAHSAMGTSRYLAAAAEEKGVEAESDKENQRKTKIPSKRSSHPNTSKQNAKLAKSQTPSMNECTTFSSKADKELRVPLTPRKTKAPLVTPPSSSKSTQVRAISMSDEAHIEESPSKRRIITPSEQLAHELSQCESLEAVRVSPTKLFRSSTPVPSQRRQPNLAVVICSPSKKPILAVECDNSCPGTPSTVFSELTELPSAPSSPTSRGLSLTPTLETRMMMLEIPNKKTKRATAVAPEGCISRKSGPAASKGAGMKGKRSKPAQTTTSRGKAKGKKLAAEEEAGKHLSKLMQSFKLPSMNSTGTAEGGIQTKGTITSSVQKYTNDTHSSKQIDEVNKGQEVNSSQSGEQERDAVVGVRRSGRQRKPTARAAAA